MNNNTAVLVVTASIAVSLIMGSHHMVIQPIYTIFHHIQMAMAQNDTNNTTTSGSASTITNQQINSSITLGNPIFIEHDKVAPPKSVVINGTQGLQASYSGSGVIKGINFSDNGTAFIVPRSDESVYVSGHTVITTTEGEKGTYEFYSLGHQEPNGSTRDNGIAFFHTTSSGKLSIVNNLIVVIKDQIDDAGNGTTIGWEWKK